MKQWLLTYKKSLFQVAGMMLAFVLTKKIAFVYVAAVLLLILIFFPGISVQITQTLDRILAFTGKWIKRILLGMMFFLVIVPISVLLRIFSKKKKDPGTAYINRDTSPLEIEKMW